MKVVLPRPESPGREGAKCVLTQLCVFGGGVAPGKVHACGSVLEARFTMNEAGVRWGEVKWQVPKLTCSRIKGFGG
jgi:hypothetical protein